VSNSLALAGYVVPTERVVEGVAQVVEQPQSDSFILVLRLIFALVPIVLVGASLFFALRYPLTAKVHRRLCRVLETRRRGGSEDEAMREEAEELERRLIGG
jgi:Na+/melibiose symporter-like transporter